jgi:hypothetical protein
MTTSHRVDPDAVGSREEVHLVFSEDGLVVVAAAGEGRVGLLRTKERWVRCHERGVIKTHRKTAWGRESRCGRRHDLFGWLLLRMGSQGEKSQLPWREVLKVWITYWMDGSGCGRMVMVGGEVAWDRRGSPTGSRKS